MNREKKRTLLFIKDTQSEYNTETKAFEALFEKVEMASTKDEALALFKDNTYDVVVGDLSVDIEGIALLKHLKDAKKEQIIFAIVASKDREKLFGISDMGINGFELEPQQFDMALEEIAKFEPANWK
jgi:DNA-binding NtrC family response regulator